MQYLTMSEHEYRPIWLSRFYQAVGKAVAAVSKDARNAINLTKSAAWLRRNYLWILIPTALLGYAGIWIFLTWEMPSIADRTLSLLSNAVDAEKADAVRNYAYALGALMAGMAFLATVPFQLVKTWVNERQARTTEQGHITDRLTKAIEQLGSEKTIKVRARTYEFLVGAGEHEPEHHSGRQIEGERFFRPVEAENFEFGSWQTFEEIAPNLEVRLGAIYALERIAQDSARDHIPIMETLCAYIRENAPASSAKANPLPHLEPPMDSPIDSNPDFI